MIFICVKFLTNISAISFVVESSYRDWDTDFPAIFLCENKNMDRVQEVTKINNFFLKNLVLKYNINLLLNFNHQKSLFLGCRQNFWRRSRFHTRRGSK